MKINPATSPVEEPGYKIGLLAARGGLGVTSVAVNLAAAVRKKTSLSVALAEFRPGHGTLHYDLNLIKTNALTELLNTQPSLTEGWWSNHLWKDGRRGKERWVGASGLGIDVEIIAGQAEQRQIGGRVDADDLGLDPVAVVRMGQQARSLARHVAVGHGVAVRRNQVSGSRPAVLRAAAGQAQNRRGHRFHHADHGLRVGIQQVKICCGHRGRVCCRWKPD